MICLNSIGLVIKKKKNHNNKKFPFIVGSAKDFIHKPYLRPQGDLSLSLIMTKKKNSFLFPTFRISKKRKIFQSLLFLFITD